MNAHVIVFGVQDDEIDYPDMGSLGSEPDIDEDDTDELERFGDVDYDDEDMKENCLGKTNFSNVSKTHWREDSK